jgi:FKBP-type peptidyl-prolyl cis-trans isomerase SlyD
MSVGLNKVITFNYTLKDEEGTILDSSTNKEPMSFISGSNLVIPKLEEALSGMIIGSKKNVKIAAADAYGEYSEDAVQKVKKEQFPEDAKIDVGMTYLANSPDGKQMPFLVSEVNDQEITIDFNHPLAGKDLEFDVELLDVRDATPEEMQHGHVHGPGGHHHH